MAIDRPDHVVHVKRRGRNTALGLVLAGFVGLIFVVTIVKLSQGQMIEGYDHAVRPSITVPE